MQPRFAKPSCHGCSLEHSGFGFAPPSGPVGAPLTFIGEALGYEEAIQGEPFYGAAGGVLSRLTQRAGIDRRQTRIANVCSCRPPGDYLVGAPWEEQAINYCRQYLQPVLDSVPPNGVVVPLGATALASIMQLRGVPGIAVKDWHGTVSRDPSNRFWVVPTFHPSHLQRGAMNLLEVCTQDLALAKRISEQGFTRAPADLIVDPHPDWFAHWCDVHGQRVEHDPEGVHLSCDTEFAEKAGGADESEVVLGDGSSPITRINGGNDAVTGWTVPYREPYIGIYERLLQRVAAARGWIWFWNKYADVDKLARAGHTVRNELCLDGMWLWHYLQSDLPRGLGFVAPMASDFGPWKHWGKDPQKEGIYAAADGVQNWRTCMWLLTAAHKQGIWDLFVNDWHERDVYVLRPAFEQGVPTDRDALEKFHAELQVKLGSVLARIKQTAAQGVLKPKLGYSKLPLPKIPTWFADCLKAKHDFQTLHVIDGQPGFRGQFVCKTCDRREPWTVTPPASILGKPKKGGGEAKSQYMLEGVRLVEREIEVTVTCCITCGVDDIGPKHRCKVQRTQNTQRRTRRDRDVPTAVGEGTAAIVADGAGSDAPPRVACLVQKSVLQRRFFWQLPFNPDAPTQVLQYLAQQGIEAPIDKKKGKKTTAKKALQDLQKKHADDPFFQLQLDWKAVQKVDSTYAVGALARLDKDDRLHPEFLPKPSTFRDSCVGVNLQNVVADKAGPDGLASGFRRCIVARDGVPATHTPEELAAWETRWA
jgi:uracil-DNA glycosylase